MKKLPRTNSVTWGILSKIDQRVRKPATVINYYFRRVLGRFGCVNDLATRKMMVLSGGQKSRVAFACLAIMKPHLLILDEPTNHLDVETVAALAKVKFKLIFYLPRPHIGTTTHLVFNCVQILYQA